MKGPLSEDECGVWNDAHRSLSEEESETDSRSGTEEEELPCLIADEGKGVEIRMGRPSPKEGLLGNVERTGEGMEFCASS